MFQVNDARIQSMVRRYEKIARNRLVLNKVIDALKFLGIRELLLRDYDESEMPANRGTPISPADSERCFSTFKRLKRRLQIIKRRTCCALGDEVDLRRILAVSQ